jgi:threonylcarbamoyladenosine tRNA methylthiotransferase MtaB
LFEQEEDEGNMYGFTENYIKVRFPYQADLVNQFQTVRLMKVGRDGLMEAVILSNESSEIKNENDLHHAPRNI